MVLAAGLATQAVAAEKLNYYCSAQEDWCQLMARGFEEATGIKVNMTRRSSGETFALIKAESANPKGDIWWGGTGDPHLQAAEEGLTQPYITPMRGEAALRCPTSAPLGQFDGCARSSRCARNLVMESQQAISLIERATLRSGGKS